MLRAPRALPGLPEPQGRKVPLVLPVQRARKACLAHKDQLAPSVPRVQLVRPDHKAHQVLPVHRELRVPRARKDRPVPRALRVLRGRKALRARMVRV